MDNDSLSTWIAQLSLFAIEEGKEQIELFPTVWGAAEQMISADVSVRKEGLERLVNMNAPRYSPLVAYIFVTRIQEPDLSLRSRIVQALGELFLPDSNGAPSPLEVRTTISRYLSQMRTRQIFALLQVIVENPALEKYVVRLISACSFASNQLMDIIVDRKLPIDIRIQAVRMVGIIGYIDAIHPLERISSRLEAKINGQKAMPFAPPIVEGDTGLIQAVQEALTNLRAL